MELIVSDDDPNVAYLKLPSHPGVGTPNVVASTKRLSELTGLADKTELILDFDADGELIGVEILA